MPAAQTEVLTFLFSTIIGTDEHDGGHSIDARLILVSVLKRLVSLAPLALVSQLTIIREWLVIFQSMQLLISSQVLSTVELSLADLRAPP